MENGNSPANVLGLLGLIAASLVLPPHLLAIYIAEKYTNVASQRPDYRGGLPIARLRKIEDYVRAHLAESISIETLAELAELSTFHFSRVFKQAMGRRRINS